jgi:endonuclease/exonuclease/phosphatase family metal-dependent hydrolase
MKTLKIATINLWAGLWPIFLDKKKRLKDFAGIVKQNDFDVIAIQEFWLKKDIKRMIRIFKNYHFIHYSGLFFNRSGLVIMSKFPVTKNRIEFFDKRRGIKTFINKFLFRESYFRKAFLTCELSVHGNTMNIVDLHVPYNRQPELNDYFRDFVFDKVRHLKNVLIFGDFNSDYKNIRVPENIHIVTGDTKSSLKKVNPYANTPTNKFTHQVWACDLIYSNFECDVLKSGTIEKPIISDHYLVWAEIGFRMEY